MNFFAAIAELDDPATDSIRNQRTGRNIFFDYIRLHGLVVPSEELRDEWEVGTNHKLCEGTGLVRIGDDDSYGPGQGKEVACGGCDNGIVWME